MRMKIVTIFALFLLFFSLAACGKPESDEERIKRIVKDAAASAEARDVKGVLKDISEEYRDDRGNDRDAIKGFVFAETMRGGALSVFITSVDVEVKGAHALVDVGAVFVRGKKVERLADLLPQEMDRRKISLVLKKADGGWKVVSASY